MLMPRLKAGAVKLAMAVRAITITTAGRPGRREWRRRPVLGADDADGRADGRRQAPRLPQDFEQRI